MKSPMCCHKSCILNDVTPTVMLVSKSFHLSVIDCLEDESQKSGVKINQQSGLNLIPKMIDKGAAPKALLEVAYKAIAALH